MAHSLYDISPLEPLIEKGYTLLTPNHRLARRIKTEWDQRRAIAGDSVWEPVPVFPLQAWLLQQWERAITLGLLEPLVPLDSLQVRELWRRVISKQEESSTSFRLLRPQAAAELAALARDNLLLWQVSMSDPLVRQSFELGADCSTFLIWLDCFEEHLGQAGQTTPVDCLAQLASLEGGLSLGKVALVESGEVAPLWRSILNSLCEAVTEIEPDDRGAHRRVYSFSDKRTELEAAAVWAAATHRQQPDVRLAIVLDDMKEDRVSLEYLLRREFDCLGENYTSLPVNFSTGVALSHAPVIRDALAVLAMGKRTCTVPEVVKILQSRFLDLPDADTPLAHHFVRRLYAGGQEIIRDGDLRYAAGSVSLGDEKGLRLGEYLLAMSTQRELHERALPSVWAARFAGIMQVWGWPGSRPLDSLEYQQLELWYKVLDAFKAYDSVCPALDYAAALELLREDCAQRMSQPKTADSAVQVLGPLEAGGLSFDELWLCGMQAGKWPGPPRPNPFIPLELQARLQMPHSTLERQWAVAEAQVSRFGRNLGVFHASYCQQIDGAPDLPSPLLVNFEEVPVEEPAAVAPGWSTLQAASNLESVQDDRAPAVSAPEAKALHGGSALLEDQSQCPFRAFARRRLRLEPLGDFSVALSAAERGSLLHVALDILWRELGGSAALLALDGQGETELTSRAAQLAIDESNDRRRRQLGSAYWGLEQQRLACVLQEWLAVERQRSEFLVVEREGKVALELQQLQLTLRVDRVDELPDGSRVIIDYKSGSCNIKDWMGDRPAKPQLLLYGLAASRAPAALSFAQVRVGDCKFVGQGEIAAAPGIRTDMKAPDRANMEVRNWQELNQKWRDNLLRITGAFIAGEASVDPLGPDSCKWCGLQPLCRIDQDLDTEVEAL